MSWQGDRAWRASGFSFRRAFQSRISKPCTVRKTSAGQRSWRRGPRCSLKDVEHAALEWVDWYNNSRLLEPIGNWPPAEAETACYVDLEEPDTRHLTQTNELPAYPERFVTFVRTPVTTTSASKTTTEIGSRRTRALWLEVGRKLSTDIGRAAG